MPGNTQNLRDGAEPGSASVSRGQERVYFYWDPLDMKLMLNAQAV